MHRRLVSLLAGSLVALVALLAIAGCGGKTGGTLIANKRPTIEVSNGPINGTDNFYDVKVDWFASDADGQVVRYIYSKDPPVMGDTVWTETRASEVDLFFSSNEPPNPLPNLGSLITERGYHTFVVKAIDNEGLASAPVSRSFNSHTTAPSTIIQVPSPTSEVAVGTVPSVTITWVGTDPDGVISQKPVKYKFKLVKASDINPVNPNGVTREAIQLYFGVDADNFFATWDSVGGDTTEKFYQGLTPNTTYYFAIVAFDEAGAFEPRFNGDSNVLAFRPTLNRLGPAITVFNQFFARTQNVGGVSLDLSRIYPLEFPVNNPVSFNWSATPATGAQITGYRWALDIPNQYIQDETPRTDDTDYKHWSTWSLAEVSTSLPAFTGVADTASHFFYLEARDNLGFLSLFTIQLVIVKPVFDRNLLIVDDMNGTATGRSRTPPGTIALVNPYPMEAEQDSFYYAKGGFPDSLRILSGTPGAISIPGTFSHFAFDTLDYNKGWPFEGISLEELGQYKVVCWYSDHFTAGSNGQKFGGSKPMPALRFINSVNHLNTLAVYLAQHTADGGKLWLFGDGTTAAIANGYFSRFSVSAIPALPYAAGDDPKAVLKAGSFLWDFCHLQSELDLADRGSALSQNARLIACLPYLPQYRLQPGQQVPPDRSLDPRVGPSAQKTLDHGWATLPRLTIGHYHGIATDPATGFGIVSKTFVISKPLFVTEGTGADFQSVADTLYLAQTQQYDPNNIAIPTADGFPNAIHYHGSLHGDVVWMGFPLYFVEPDQARQLADVVLHDHFGLPFANGSNAGAHPASAAHFGAPVVQAGYGGVPTMAVRRAGR